MVVICHHTKILRTELQDKTHWKNVTEWISFSCEVNSCDRIKSCVEEVF